MIHLAAPRRGLGLLAPHRGGHVRPHGDDPEPALELTGDPFKDTELIKGFPLRPENTMPIQVVPATGEARLPAPVVAAGADACLDGIYEMRLATEQLAVSITQETGLGNAAERYAGSVLFRQDFKTLPLFRETTRVCGWTGLHMRPPAGTAAADAAAFLYGGDM